jgi:hypothetical protein
MRPVFGILNFFRKHLEMPCIKAIMEGMKKAFAGPVQMILRVMVSPGMSQKRK